MALAVEGFVFSAAVFPTAGVFAIANPIRHDATSSTAPNSNQYRKPSKLCSSVNTQPAITAAIGAAKPMAAQAGLLASRPSFVLRADTTLIVLMQPLTSANR